MERCRSEAVAAAGTANGPATEPPLYAAAVSWEGRERSWWTGPGSSGEADGRAGGGESAPCEDLSEAGCVGGSSAGEQAVEQSMGEVREGSEESA